MITPELMPLVVLGILIGTGFLAVLIRDDFKALLVCVAFAGIISGILFPISAHDGDELFTSLVIVMLGEAPVFLLARVLAFKTRRRKALDLLKVSPWRTIVPGTGLVLLFPLVYWIWPAGKTVRDGRHDRGQNGIWLQHGWLGDDSWFHRNDREDRKPFLRNRTNVVELAGLLKSHRVQDVFPHLCPCSPKGTIPEVDDVQTRAFLEEFREFRVIPWIGGVFGDQASPEDVFWRSNFIASAALLLERHPGFAGIHVNIEPMPSGNQDFLKLLTELRAALPKGKVLSVAAYPPPTRWHPFPAVHWDEAYFREVAVRSDQMAVMMYDTAITHSKIYQHLMAEWTVEVLSWSEGKSVLLGIPAYEDANVEYHDPAVENVKNSLLGIHRGLSRFETMPPSYQGVALYSEWQMDRRKWREFRLSFNRSY